MNLLKTGKISVCEEQKSKGTVAVAQSKKAVKYKKAELKKAGFEPCLTHSPVIISPGKLSRPRKVRGITPDGKWGGIFKTFTKNTFIIVTLCQWLEIKGERPYL